MGSFIDAKSMITPGVAGTIVMFLTNALSGSFSLPGRWVALVLSFVCGLIVFGDKKLSLPPRIAFYVLNSLIVFATAVGTNGIGAAASSEPPPAAVGGALPATPTPAAAAAPTSPPTTEPSSAAPTPSRPTRVQPAQTFFKPWLQPAARIEARPVR